ncbi:uncharacterized protein BROUX77_004424 [Berkeleyomyces rouxiae]|uniref:uncharacterized protein n=1 Tax=Berkeleyomyces rouxiae TaxID=2035830 RepID=UPI003B81D582
METATNSGIAISMPSSISTATPESIFEVQSLQDVISRLIDDDIKDGNEKDLKLDAAVLWSLCTMASLNRNEMQEKRRGLIKAIISQVKRFTAVARYLDHNVTQRKLRKPAYEQLHKQYCAKNSVKLRNEAVAELKRTGDRYCEDHDCKADETLIWERVSIKTAESRAKNLSRSATESALETEAASSRSSGHMRYHGLKKITEETFDYDAYVENLDASIEKRQKVNNALEKLIAFRNNISIAIRENQKAVAFKGAAASSLRTSVTQIGRDKTESLNLLDLERRYQTLLQSARSHNQAVMRDITGLARSEKQVLSFKLEAATKLLYELKGNSPQAKERIDADIKRRTEEAKTRANWQEWPVRFKKLAQMSAITSEAMQNIHKTKDALAEEEKSTRGLGTEQKLSRTMNKLLTTKNELKNAKTQIANLVLMTQSPTKAITLAVKRAERMLNVQHSQLLERVTYDYERRFRNVKTVANNLRAALETQVSALTLPEGIPTVAELLDRREATRAEIHAEFKDEITRLEEDAAIREAEIKSLRLQIVEANASGSPPDTAAAESNSKPGSISVQAARWTRSCSVAKFLRSQNSRLTYENRLLQQRDSWLATASGESTEELAEKHEEEINRLRETYQDREFKMQSSMELLQGIVDTVQDSEAQSLVKKLKSMADEMYDRSKASVKDHMNGNREWAKIMLAKQEFLDNHETAVKSVDECIAHLTTMGDAYRQTLKVATATFPPLRSSEMDSEAAMSRKAVVAFLEKSYKTFIEMTKEDLNRLISIKNSMDRHHTGQGTKLTRVNIYQMYLATRNRLEDARCEAFYYKGLVSKVRDAIDQPQAPEILQQQLIDVTAAEYTPGKPLFSTDETSSQNALLGAEAERKSQRKIQQNAMATCSQAFTAMREMKASLDQAIRLRNRERLEKEKMKSAFHAAKEHVVSHCLSLEADFNARVMSLESLSKAKIERHMMQEKALQLEAAQARSLSKTIQADLDKANLELKALKSRKDLADEQGPAYKKMMKLIENQAAKYKQSVGDCEQRVARLKSAQALLTQKLADETNRLLDTEEQLREATNNREKERADLLRRLQESVAQMTKIELEAATAREELIHTKHLMASAQNTVKAQESGLKALKNDRDSIKISYKKAEEQLRDREERLVLVSRQQTSEEARFTAAVSSVNKNMTRKELIAVMASLAASIHDDTVKRLESQIQDIKNTLQGKILRREAEINSLSEKLAAIPSDKTELETQCTMYHHECNTLRQNLTRVQGKLSEQTKEASDLASEVVSLKERIDRSDGRIAYIIPPNTPAGDILDKVTASETQQYSKAIARIQTEVKSMAAAAAPRNGIKAKQSDAITHNSADELFAHFAQDAEPADAKLTERDVQMFWELAQFRGMRADLAKLMVSRQAPAFEEQMQNVQDFLSKSCIAQPDSPHRHDVRGSLCVLQGFSDLHQGNLSLAMENLAKAERHGPSMWESKVYAKLTSKLCADIAAEQQLSERYPANRMDDVHARCLCKVQIYRCRDHRENLACGCKFRHLLDPCFKHAEKFELQVKQAVEHQSNLRAQFNPAHDGMISASVNVLKRINGSAFSNTLLGDSSEKQPVGDVPSDTLQSAPSGSPTNSIITARRGSDVGSDFQSSRASIISDGRSRASGAAVGVSLADELQDISDFDEQNDYESEL